MKILVIDVGAVEAVADDGVAEFGEMTTNLVLAAGFDLDVEEGSIGVCFENIDYAAGGAAIDGSLDRNGFV